MVFATFQDFELDLELHCYGQGCQCRQLCFLLLCGRVQSNHDDKEILLCTLLIDATTLAEKTAHMSIDFSYDAKELNVKLETMLRGV